MAKKSVSWITLWDKIASALVSKNNSNYGETRNRNMYVDLLGLYSGEDNVTYVYTIDGYPHELEMSFRTSLRSCCTSGVRISFITPLEKTEIDWSSPQVRAKLSTWRSIEQDGDDIDEYNLHKELLTFDNQEWRKDSLVYLSTADKRRKRKLFKLRCLMLVSGKRGDDFNKVVKNVVKSCKNMGIKFSRIIGDIPAFLSFFSPFSNVFDTQTSRECGAVSMPDELLARFNTYSQGIIGKSGKYFGTDIYSGFPVLKPVKITAESAETWLFTAETGGGKSFFVKGVLVQLLADDMYNGTINDVEGFEYIPIANYMKNHDLVAVLNMGEGTGSYYDPVEIIMTGNPELDADMYSLSVSFTLSLMKCLLGGTTEKDEWADIVINDAVSLTYGRNNVSAYDMDTWENSQGLTLYSVYETLKSLKTSGSADINRAVSNMFTHSLYEEKMGIGSKLEQNDVNRLINSNEEYQKSIELCIAKLSRYFEPNGVRAHLFRNRISIESVKDAKLVICSFGMAGKSENTVDPIQMSLMQLYAANISHLRSIFSKSAGKYNFKLWEEFQRWGGFPDADKTINVALTGGRKLGDINIIITNKPGELLHNDKFGIFSNLTSVAIGCIWDADIRSELCERLTIQHMLPELDTLVENNKDLSSYIDGDTVMQNPYSKAFLIGLDKTVYTLSKMSLPRGLRESKIFRTGVDIKKKGESVDED